MKASLTKNLDHWLRAGFKEAFGYESERKEKRQSYPLKEAHGSARLLTMQLCLAVV